MSKDKIIKQEGNVLYVDFKKAPLIPAQLGPASHILGYLWTFQETQDAARILSSMNVSIEGLLSYGLMMECAKTAEAETKRPVKKFCVILQEIEDVPPKQPSRSATV